MLRPDLDRLGFWPTGAVFREPHVIGAPARILGDLDLLLSVNLVHEHQHAHGRVVHSLHGPEHHHDDSATMSTTQIPDSLRCPVQAVQLRAGSGSAYVGHFCDARPLR